ncbi:hypothetical protein B5F08_11910 [Anaeromassilibacillus sp. An172]|uniref:accessory gene regulator ArgB-like protein n=1 Tax=Anaeromassilibacillus sp. An172 TaxID=1965570 RepID=UPI000B3818C5|nr:hypothetical protein B5F08_11910 [Anaeromassilibacillus sp. An172]
MQHHLSQSIADFLLCQKIINKKEKEIYIYGIQLFLSSIVNLLICITISLLLDELANGILFFVLFSSLRRFTGGFHCKTFIMCNIVFSMIVTFVLLVNRFVGNIFGELVFFIATVFFCFMCIWLFSPVYNKNKKLTNIEIKKFKIISIVVYMIHIFFYFLILIIFNYRLNIILTGDLIVVFMILLGVVNNKKL